MAEGQSGGGFRRVKLYAITALIVAALGCILYLAGQLNAHRYYLVREGRNLLVYRGAAFPFMTRQFIPQTAADRVAYSPIRLPARWDGSQRQSFSDRSALDRGIYAMMEKRLRDEFYTGRLPNMERVNGSMMRIKNLSGLSDEDRRGLSEIQGDYAYLKAREIVDGLPESLNEARRLCDLAERQGTGRLGDPREFSQRLSQWMQLLVHTPVVQPLPPTKDDVGATIFAPAAPPVAEEPATPPPPTEAPSAEPDTPTVPTAQ